MFVHWALDKRTPVQARENGAKPELLSFTKTSFILFWTFTVETCKLILLAVVNFIRYGLLSKINFRRASPGAGRPPGGALQHPKLSLPPSPPPTLPLHPSPVRARPGVGGGAAWGSPCPRPPVLGLCPAPRPGEGAPKLPGPAGRERRGAAGSGGYRGGGAASSKAAPKVSQLVRCLQQTRGLRGSESS